MKSYFKFEFGRAMFSKSTLISIILVTLCLIIPYWSDLKVPYIQGGNMRRIVIAVLGLLLLIFSIFYIYEVKFNSPMLYVEKIAINNIEKDERIDNISYHFGLNQKEITDLENNENKIKVVEISCRCENKSYFKKVEQGNFIFESSDKLPDIIMGNKIEDMFITPLHLKANQTIDRTIRILINERDYNNEEIMNKLKNVRIKFVDLGENGEVKVESKSTQLQSDD